MTTARQKRTTGTLERAFDEMVTRVPSRKCRAMIDGDECHELGYLIGAMIFVAEWMAEWEPAVRPAVAYGLLLEGARAARNAGVPRAEAIEAVLSQYPPDPPLTPAHSRYDFH